MADGKTTRFALVFGGDAVGGPIDRASLQARLREVAEDDRLGLVEAVGGPGRALVDSTRSGYQRVEHAFAEGDLHNRLGIEVLAVRRLRLVLLIHGILTEARWQESIRDLLEDEFTKVEPIGYGLLDPVRFWLPSPLRSKPIRTVQKKMQAAILDNRGEHRELVIIAHSFGSYSLVRILDDNPQIEPERLLFCGSIVQQGFRWDKLPNKPTEIINETGSRDIWPVLAHSTTFGYGSTGTYGFKTPGVRDRLHELPHSGYFKGTFAKDFWLPWVREGRYIRSAYDDREGPRTPWLTKLLELLPLRYLQPIGLLLLLWLLAPRAGLPGSLSLNSVMPILLRPFGAIGRIEWLYPLLILVFLLGVTCGLILLRGRAPRDRLVRVPMQLALTLLVMSLAVFFLIAAAKSAVASHQQDVEQHAPRVRKLTEVLRPSVSGDGGIPEERLDGTLKASLEVASRRMPFYEALGVTGTSDIASVAGRYAYYRQNWQEAGELFESAVRADGTAAQLNDLGVQRWQSGDLDAAEEYFRRARALEPSFNGALNGLGLVAFSRARAAGDDPTLLAEAVRYFEEALEADPNFGKVHNNLGLAYRRLGKRERDPEAKAGYFDMAEASFERAVDLPPAGPEPLHNLGLLSQDRADYPRAVAYYQSALERNPDYTKSLNNIAWIHTSIEGLVDPETAVSYAEKLMTLTPDNPGNRDTLARALHAAGRQQEALNEARRARADARAQGSRHIGTIEQFLREVESDLEQQVVPVAGVADHVG